MPNTIDEYIESLPEGNKEAFLQLRSVVKKNLPKGFEETFQYKMIGYVVPKKLYPAGYHVNPELALPFLHIAVQKSGLALYHMGIYADPTLLKWFQTEYPKHCKTKLDMGKSCIRFKKLEDIPWKLIGELVSKMSPKDWIHLYDSNLPKKKSKEDKAKKSNSKK
ncbi:DUF1801 domain-containing protein [Leptospira levettii]|uniref:DUF1801 domain-containing protein n=1 Tax=Leptospira levettii TaxID=2023178 RepID=UPI0010832A5E|nr:DUF1801 domain-containing protein [Leptospira levettii]TGM24846.1 DUF1801 domain-containing protein [Leptospira levettii]